MHRTRHIWMLLVLLCACPTLNHAQANRASDEVYLTPQASDDLTEMEQALIKRLRKEGRQHYANGAYEQAVKKFEEAYKISGDDNFLYDLALTFHVLRDWDRCVGLLGRYIDTAPAGPKKDRAFNTMQSCKARREISQTLRIDSSPRGARVYLNNLKTASKGQTPLVLNVKPGVKRIWLILDGYEQAIRDVDVSRTAPMHLMVDLKQRVEKGWLFVDSDVRDAQIYLDGKPLQLTPQLKPLPVAAGRHQIQLRRQGFDPFQAFINIERFQMTRVDAAMSKSTGASTWRSSLGWTAVALGLVAVVGGGVATHFADQEYNDTPTFERLQRYEYMGYGIGGTLFSIGTGLVLWDTFRNHISVDEKNPLYGNPMETPDPDQLER
ncbi:MAG: PEGA domain-containing protein [Myxococcota bacterium]|nr:PEGA domain-containing protein [Myxococcota bacterium]